MLEHLDTFIAFAVVMAGVSLLITVMTQMASALLGLRGTNLRWGIATLLQNVDPKLAEQAARLSDQILNHRLISDSACSKFEGWEAKPAPAGVAPPPAKTDRLAWVKRGVWWFVSQWKLASSIRKEELLAILKILGQSIPAESMAERRAMLARLEAGIGEWFDAVMDRVSQRFLVHMRVWTAIFSLLAAFALHLDSFRLLSQFAADKELRDNLVATAGAMTRQAEQILNTTSTNDPAAFARAVTQLASQFPELTAAVAQRPAFASLPEIEQWLNQQLAGSTNQAAALNRLRQNLFQDRVEALRDQSDSIRAEIRLDPSRIEQGQVPAHSRSVSRLGLPWQGGRHWYSWSNLHFWGILASGALLSLGAPFWYNTLKTLTNLRPILAQKEAGEKKAGKSPAT